MCVLRHLEILQNSSRSSYAVVHVVDAETLQRANIKVFLEFFSRTALIESPIVKLVNVIFSENLKKFVAFSPFHEHFLGRKIGKELIHVFRCAFCAEKFACGYVEKGKSARPVAEINGSKKVVFL